MRTRAERLIAVLVSVLVSAFVGALATACTVDGPVPPPLRDGRLLWQSDLETGDLSQFKDVEPNGAGSPPPTLVTTPTRSGDHAVAFTVPGPSAPDACCGSRTVLLPKFRDIETADDLYFGFSTYLRPGFPTDTHWQSIVQFTQNVDGPPPLGLYVEDGQYRIEGGNGHPSGAQPFNKPLLPTATGRWVDWVIHVVFSPDPKVAYVEAWADGRPVLERFAPAAGTLYPAPAGADFSRVAFGYSRQPTIAPAGTVVFDELRIGTSFGAVRHIDQAG